jgi:hypothetical protein
MRKTSVGGDAGVGSTYTMERTLPTGRAVNDLVLAPLARRGLSAASTTTLRP